MADLGWVPSAERRARAKLKIFYKGKNNMLCIPFDHLRPCNSSTRRSDNCFVVPSSNNNAHLHSFYPNTIRLWNGLPNSLKTSASIDCFTQGLERVELRYVYKSILLNN